MRSRDSGRNLIARKGRHSPGSLRRALAWLAVLAPYALVGLTGAVALAQESGQATGQEMEEAFSGLTVIAFGEQEVDIITGITTLPEGGQVVDREHGVTLTAETMRYREGDFVEAETVEVSGRFGTARSDSMSIDLDAAVVEAFGNVRFEREELRLLATSLRYDVKAAVVQFQGPVTGEGVELEAAAMLLDADSGSVLLVGPYRYQDELFELSSEREGALLSLTPAEDESGRMVASSRVDPDLIERLGPYLP